MKSGATRRTRIGRDKGELWRDCLLGRRLLLPLAYLSRCNLSQGDYDFPVIGLDEGLRPAEKLFGPF